MLCHSLVNRMLCVNEESLSHTDLTKPVTMFSDGQGTVLFTCSVTLACTSYLLTIKNCHIRDCSTCFTHKYSSYNKLDKFLQAKHPLFGNFIITRKLTCMSKCVVAHERYVHTVCLCISCICIPCICISCICIPCICISCICIPCICISCICITCICISCICILSWSLCSCYQMTDMFIIYIYNTEQQFGRSSIM